MVLSSLSGVPIMSRFAGGGKCDLYTSEGGMNHTIDWSLYGLQAVVTWMMEFSLKLSRCI